MDTDEEARRSDLIDVSLALHHETPKALLVSDDGDREHAIWLPKFLIEFEHWSRNTGGRLVKVTLPEWLAKEKGLI